MASRKGRATPLLEWYQRPILTVISEILAAEKSPMSDEALSMRLNDKGIPTTRAVVRSIRKRNQIPNRWARQALREKNA